MDGLQDFTARVEAFKQHILPARSVLIAVHDYPDPDCLASGFGLGNLLTYWGVDRWEITHGGFVGRAENRMMMQLLDIKTTPFALIDLQGFDKIIMVDSLPGGGNVSLPEDVKVHAVFDHHGEADFLPDSCFKEVHTQIGATSTLVAHYLFAAQCPLSLKLATALFYGIKTDTQDMAMDVLPEDLVAYRRLFELIEHRLLAQIEHPPRNIDFFRTLYRASASFSESAKVGLVNLGRVNTPDHVAEMADLFHSLEESEYTVSCAFYEDGLFFSIRCKKNRNAGTLAKKIAGAFGCSGGGHERAGAGRISVSKEQEEEKLEAFRKVVRKHLGIEGSQIIPLVDRKL
ncbi:Pyrophosphatase [Desulfatibacillum aliphaticivorans]|uniref:Pyrophosphatase n=1 Tax=Desulfatibacillum aliphaticivorans TaxID=218208 RepID=B8FCV5_DESAL|nr:DHHA1 domain-containing protein [Desulfatibacillum aliphaticivorans]ACL06386.1 Pyrophosphatase [Desulfatibacillum aliphaticivorans]